MRGGKEFGLLTLLVAGFVAQACSGGDKPETNAAGLPVDTTPVPGRVINYEEPETPTPKPNPTATPGLITCVQIGDGGNVTRSVGQIKDMGYFGNKYELRRLNGQVVQIVVKDEGGLLAEGGVDLNSVSPEEIVCPVD